MRAVSGVVALVLFAGAAVPAVFGSISGGHAPSPVMCGGSQCPPAWECCNGLCFKPTVDQCCSASTDYVCGLEAVCCTSPLGSPGACCAVGNCTGDGTCGIPKPPSPQPSTVSPLPTPANCDDTGLYCDDGLACCYSGAPSEPVCYNATSQQCCHVAEGRANYACGNDATCCSFQTQHQCCPAGTMCDAADGSCQAPRPSVAPPSRSPDPTGARCGSTGLYCAPGYACCEGGPGSAPTCYDPSYQQCCHAAQGRDSYACDSNATCCASGDLFRCCPDGNFCSVSGECEPVNPSGAPPSASPAPTPANCDDTGLYCDDGLACCYSGAPSEPVCYNATSQQCCHVAEGRANYACGNDATCCNFQTQHQCCPAGTMCDAVDGSCQVPPSSP